MRLLLLLFTLLTLTHAHTPSHPRRKLLFADGEVDTIKTPATWIHPAAQHHQYQWKDSQHKHLESWTHEMHTLENTATTTTLDGDNGERHTYVVQFISPYTFAAKQKVQAFLNTNLGSYIPHDAFLVYLYATQVQSLLSDNDMKLIVATVLPYKASNKIHSCVKNATSDQGLELDLLLVSDYTKPQQLSMGTTWGDGLTAQIPSNLNPSSFQWSLSARNIMGLSLTNEAQVLAFAQWMANMDEVVMIQRRVTFRNGNMWARSEAQNGLPIPDYVKNQGILTMDHPELRGQGEVIGFSDTGLDYQSCFFWDPAFPQGPPGVKAYTSQLTTSSITRAVPIDQRHRKVVQYVNYVDDNDGDGHGTHVAGTLAGNGWNFPKGSSMSNFNGMASEAKLAFFDIGDSLTGRLDVPRNMDQDLFIWAYQAGARIHSNSWGGLSGGYDLNAQMVDQFIYKNDDMLILFAAGNDGIKGVSSISSPATAKNALAIGSSMNSNQAWVQSFCSDGFLPTPKLCAVAQQYPIIFGETSMSAFSSLGPTPDTVEYGRLKPEIVLPGEWILSALKGQDNATSCQGTPQQLLKRDAGTSMATPMGASFAAIIRQWLRQGYYPSGIPTIDDQFTPSASLLKAIMIASARPLTGVYDGNDILFPGGRAKVPTTPVAVQLEPTPNYRQGYGRFELMNGIYFPSDLHRILILQDRNNKYFDSKLSADQETKTMTFCVTGTLPGKLPPRVTLTWTDPPVIATVSSVVVNNLDLTVTPLGGSRIFQGNEGLSGITIPDAINNVESVVLPNTESPTTYTATVLARSLGQGPQSFSLVVSGRVKMGACSTAPIETFQWISSAWGSCSQPCFSSTIGIQKRDVTCLSSLNGRVDDIQCIRNYNLGSKPTETQACNTNPCYLIKYYWTPGSYGTCTETCGGTKTRKMVCMGSTGFPATDDQFCSGSKPAVTTTCSQDPCKNALSAAGTQWSVTGCACSTPCGGGTCTRTVTCKQNGQIVADSICITNGNGARPIPLQACNTQSCAPVASSATDGSESFSWLVSDWSSCSVTCGGGIQTRSVRCRSSAGYLDEDNLCQSTPKPITTTTCASDPCPSIIDPPTYNWVIGVWGACNVQTNQQTRWVICASTQGTIVDSATCESAVTTMPITSRPCTPTSTSQLENLRDPVYEWQTGIYSDPTIWCGSGAGRITRLPHCLGTAGRVAPSQASCPTPTPIIDSQLMVNATCSTKPTWYTGQWLSECTNTVNPCQGVQQRHVVCVGTDGAILGDTTACTDIPPLASRQCATCRLTSAAYPTISTTSPWLLTILSICLTIVFNYRS